MPKIPSKVLTMTSATSAVNGTTSPHYDGNNVSALSVTQLAYLAALIDGEGYLGCQKSIQKGGKTPQFRIRLQFAMATSEPIEIISRWLGNRPVSWHKPVDDKRSATCRMQLGTKMTINLLNRCMPYLILKKEQAVLCIEIESVRERHTPSLHVSWRHRTMPNNAISEMEELYTRLRKLMSDKKPITCRYLHVGGQESLFEG